MSQVSIYEVPLSGTISQYSAYHEFDNYPIIPTCKSDGGCPEITGNVKACPTGTYPITQLQYVCPTKPEPDKKQTTCFYYYKCSYVNPSTCPSIPHLELRNAEISKNNIPGTIGQEIEVDCIYYPSSPLSEETANSWKLYFGSDNTYLGPLLKVLCSNKANADLSECRGLISSITTPSGLDINALITEALKESTNNSGSNQASLKELESLKKKPSDTGLIVGIVILVLALVAIIGYLIYRYMKKKKKAAPKI